eukprot:10521193-Karenia_brevis.AAC.1
MAKLGTRKVSPTVPFWVLRALEYKIVENEADDDELVVIGCILMLLMLRARFSDLHRTLDIEVKDERVTVTVESTKTSAKSKARLPVTLIGSVKGLTGGDWLSGILEGRKKIGLPFP